MPSANDSRRARLARRRQPDAIPFAQDENVKPNAVLKADGNIRIPAALRKSVGAKAGQQFDVIAKGSIIVLVPAVDVRTLRGSARGADISEYRDS